MFLLIVDSYTKWIDIILMTKTDANSTIAVLKSNFAIYGLPKTIVSDNGPPFTSKIFVQFLEINGIEVLKSPSYHPQSNGIAERAVQTVKSSLRKYIVDEKTRNLSMKSKIDNFLFRYRNSPSTVTGENPPKLMFAFSPKTSLNLINPRFHSEKWEENRHVINKDNEVQDRTKIFENCKFRTKKSSIKNNNEMDIKSAIIKKTFKKGQKVLYQNVFKEYVKWIPAKIVEKFSDLRYKININGSIRHAHLDQLKEYNIKEVKFSPTKRICNDNSNGCVSQNEREIVSECLTTSNELELRRSTRERKKPKFFTL